LSYDFYLLIFNRNQALFLIYDILLTHFNIKIRTNSE